MSSDGPDSMVSVIIVAIGKIAATKGDGQLSQRIVPVFQINGVLLYLTIFSTTVSAG
jgi:hypothetical protein